MKFGLNLLCGLVLVSCHSNAPVGSFTLKPQLQVQEPVPEVIEVVTPLDPTKSANANLPNRIDLTTPKATAPDKRLAVKMKSMASSPENFEKKVSLNLKLDNAELTSVIEAFKEQLHFQYILDPGVKGVLKTNISLEDTLTVQDCWNLFEQTLYLCDAYVVVDQKQILRIMPLNKLKQESAIDLKGDDGKIGIEYFRLTNSDATVALAALQPYLSKGASATVLSRSNSILLVETSSNLIKLRSLLQILDDKGQSGWPQIAYTCQHVNSALVLTELQTALPVLGFNLSQGADKGFGVKVASLDRLQVIIISAANQAVLTELQRWLEILDSPETGEEGKIFNYSVQHGDPNDLVKAISLFFSNTNSSMSTRSAEAFANNSTTSRAGSSIPSYSSPLIPSPLPMPSPAPLASPVRAPNDSRKSGSLYDQPVTIYQDNRRNQLMIRTSSRTYNMMKAIMKYLDAPPMQVIIQVTAVEIDLNDNLEFGFEFAAKKLFGGNEALGGIGSPVEASKFGPAGDVTPGVSMMFKRAGVDNEFAFVKAVAGKTSSRLLFCPHIQTLNDQPAELNIGQSVPTRRGSNSSQVGFQDNIDYRDTGVILRVTPQISADKSVIVTTEVEISDLSKDIVKGIESPIINNNNMKTRLLIKDGDTILLGGIITKKESNSESGVPLLKDIPLLGWLFKGINDTHDSKELVLFVKATVVQNPSDIEKLMKRYDKSVKLINETPGVP